MITSVHKPKDLCGNWHDENGMPFEVKIKPGEHSIFLFTYDSLTEGLVTIEVDHEMAWRLCGVSTREDA